MDWKSAFQIVAEDVSPRWGSGFLNWMNFYQSAAYVAKKVPLERNIGSNLESVYFLAPSGGQMIEALVRQFWYFFGAWQSEAQCHRAIRSKCRPRSNLTHFGLCTAIHCPLTQLLPNWLAANFEQPPSLGSGGHDQGVSAFYTLLIIPLSTHPPDWSKQILWNDGLPLPRQ